VKTLARAVPALIFGSAIALLQPSCGGADESEFGPGGDGGGGGDSAFAGDGGGPAGCVGIECLRPTNCPTGTNTTSISGTVFDPAGKNPLYNVIVYIPNGELKPITDGASCDRCGQTITGQPIRGGVALTKPDGTFTLPDAPAGVDIPIVMQVGKWRRKIVLPKTEACANTTIDPAMSRLPKNRAEGNIPKIAVTTGAADAFECLLRKVGIEDGEFGTPTSNPEARIHLYGGYGYSDPAAHSASAGFANGTPFPKAQPLWDDVEALKKYDMTLLACEGEPDVAKNQATKPKPENIYNYALAGGRVFAAHYHRYWFAQGPAETKAIGVWPAEDRKPPAFPVATNPVPGTIMTKLPDGADFPKGQALHDWLFNVKALEANDTLTIKEARQDLDSVTPGKGATTWIRAPKSAAEPNGEANIAQYISFNAPLGKPDAELCGRVVFSDLHVSSGNSKDEPGYPFPNTGGATPKGCVTPDLSPQEKALEFMLFDLSSCVQSDNVAPVIK
jgi:hypothetical protein